MENKQQQDLSQWEPIHPLITQIPGRIFFLNFQPFTQTQPVLSQIGTVQPDTLWAFLVTSYCFQG